MQQSSQARIEPGSPAADAAADRLDRQAGELLDTADELTKKKLKRQAEDLEQVAESLVATAQLLRDGIVKPEPRRLHVIGGRGHAIPDHALRDAIRAFGDEPFSAPELADQLGINPQTAKRKIGLALDKGWCGEAGLRQLGPGRPTPLYAYKRPVSNGAHQRPTGGREHHLAGLDPKKVTEPVKRGAPIALSRRPKHAVAEVEAMFQVAEERGWNARLSGGGHWKVVAPNGYTVTCSASPSDRRSLVNARAVFRRAGLPV